MIASLRINVTLPFHDDHSWRMTRMTSLLEEKDQRPADAKMNQRYSSCALGSTDERECPDGLSMATSVVVASPPASAG
tara:strand:- start:174 stop:407 length:234 start_codon:yes stop_codon:yes gene_type:complete